MSGSAECNTSIHNYRPQNAMAPMKVVLNNCLVQQNVMQVQITRSPNATGPIKVV